MHLDTVLKSGSFAIVKGCERFSPRFAESAEQNGERAGVGNGALRTEAASEPETRSAKIQAKVFYPLQTSRNQKGPKYPTFITQRRRNGRWKLNIEC
jgi:hypothetical protein